MEIGLKYKLVEKLIQTEDETVLNEIKELLGLGEVDFWKELPSGIIEHINQAKKDLDSGSGIPNSDVINEIEKRFL